MTPTAHVRACFEVSWEVANAVGGIHTVIASKVEQMKKVYGDYYFVIGPLQGNYQAHQHRVWEEGLLDPNAMKALEKVRALGVSFKTGKWKLPDTTANGLLIDFSKLWSRKDSILADYWERYGLNSLQGGSDYDEPVLFSVASAMAVEHLHKLWLAPLGVKTILHAHEWLAAASILHMKHACPEIGCVFTTHATVLGRALASRSNIPEEILPEAEAARLAQEYGVSSKYSMECLGAKLADAFTTVSETTALECERLLGVVPHGVLHNALEENYPPRELRKPAVKKKARKRLLEIASKTTGFDFSAHPADEPIILMTSGRYEFRNKGLDLFAEALGVVQSTLGPVPVPRVVVFFMVPADSESFAPSQEREKYRLTHALRHPYSDPLLDVFERSNLRNTPIEDQESSVHVVWVPKFLELNKTTDSVSETYFELLAGADLTVFPSWYEPWGYTPMESIALGIPTVTSDLTGYAGWAVRFGNESATGVFRIKRRMRTHRESVMELAELILSAVQRGRPWLKDFEEASFSLAEQGYWTKGINAYLDAHQLAIHATESKKTRPGHISDFHSAYFSMEFGIKADLRVYSGGLGILAGDFLKAARDLDYKVCGIGLAYREGYFHQRISEALTQEVMPAEHASFEKNGLIRILDKNGLPLVFEVPLANGQRILSSAWKLELGSSMLLLLDPDMEANPPELRSLARRLYTSDRRGRWLQEYFIGIGGVKLLHILGIKPDWFHMNEGHTAMLAFEQVRFIMQEKHLNFEEALSEFRQKTLFTTHTPVPAGHEEFDRDICFPEIEMIAGKLRIHTERIFELGRSQKGNKNVFSLTSLSLNMSAKVNAVSKRHKEAAVQSFEGMAMEGKDFFYITNGVHPQTWLSTIWKEFFYKHVGKEWAMHVLNAHYWAKALDFNDKAVWDCHAHNKANLFHFMQEHFTKGEIAKSRKPALKKVLELLEQDPFVGVFARRFAAYKRPGLLFSDKDRLKKLIEQYPKTLFVFGGKAHPADGQGHDLIHLVLEMENSKEFAGHVCFIADYAIDIAQLLVSGADVWLNVPVQPLEASGTSGMKAAMNGVLNLSVNDGWVCEASHGEVPWKMGLSTENLEKPMMDWTHAQELYAFLEQKVFPEFWKRNAEGVPVGWVQLMKYSMAGSIPYFSAQRMIKEYAEHMNW